MAMLFHCSSLNYPPKRFIYTSWQHYFSTKFSLQGDRAMLSFDPMKCTLSGQKASSGTSNIRCLSRRELPMSQLQQLKSSKACITTSLQSPESILQCYVNQEAQTKFPAMGLVLTNAVLVGMAMPLEALAETCLADNSPFKMNMPLLLFVSLIGAIVGGLLARQRKGELQRLNEQLRQINAALRRQAKIESYAPALSYAPARAVDTDVIIDPKKEGLISRLKTEKNYLRNLDLENAYTEFKIALEHAQDLKDPIEEKKAARGVGASLQRQGKYREAIEYHKMVLAISKRVGETSGNTEAYGAIADCYTELGDLENAGKFYDKYIARLEAD